MSLLATGRARLALALPRHRDQLRSTKNHQLNDMFEAYALAARTLENLLREIPQREAMVREYQDICLDLQSEVVTLLASMEVRRS